MVFRLTKMDAFSGVSLLRLLLRMEGKAEQGSAPTILDLISSLSEEELRSVMTSCLNNVSVLLPAGPNPVMTGPEWSWPEIERDTAACMRLMIESIAWNLQGFFGGGGRSSPPAPRATSP